MEKNKYLEYLETQYGFAMPNLPLDKINNVELRKVHGGLRLFVDNNSWMEIHLDHYREVYQFFSHYTLAQGNVLCSGMGLLLRESWLISKGVNITLVEVNESIIEYHRKHNSPILDSLSLIHQDIHSHLGSYDVVLLDHYEHEADEWIIEDVKKVMKNIDCDVLWFWPLERICYKNGGWDFYCELKKEIPQLPNLDREVFDLFMKNYFKDYTPRVKSSNFPH